MIQLKVLKKYKDVKLDKEINQGEVIEVDQERGLELLEKARITPALGFTIMRIDKLRGKKDAVNSRKKRG